MCLRRAMRAGARQLKSGGMRRRLGCLTGSVGSARPSSTAAVGFKRTRRRAGTARPSGCGAGRRLRCARAAPDPISPRRPCAGRGPLSDTPPSDRFCRRARGATNMTQTIIGVIHLSARLSAGGVFRAPYDRPPPLDGNFASLFGDLARPPGCHGASMTDGDRPVLTGGLLTTLFTAALANRSPHSEQRHWASLIVLDCVLAPVSLI